MANKNIGLKNPKLKTLKIVQITEYFFKTSLNILLDKIIFKIKLIKTQISKTRKIHKLQ